MRKFLLSIAVVVLLSSCTVTVNEPAAEEVIDTVTTTEIAEADTAAVAVDTTIAE
jgi:uncharacterized protein YceK